MKMVKSFVALFLHILLYNIGFFLSLFDDDIIAFILGVNFFHLTSYHFLSSFFAPSVIFSFFYKCSGCEMRISCANVK